MIKCPNFLLFISSLSPVQKVFQLRKFACFVRANSLFLTNSFLSAQIGTGPFQRSEFDENPNGSPKAGRSHPGCFESREAIGLPGMQVHL